jgi:TIR domain-containing protein
MKVFLTHARKDAALARKLAEQLSQSGLTVWIAEQQVWPGDNWAKKIGKALEDSEFMVILLTPDAFESDWLLQKDLQFALGAEKYAGRVFSVFVGSTHQAKKETPWVLQKLPKLIVKSAEDFAEVAKEIQALCAEHSHA